MARHAIVASLLVAAALIPACAVPAGEGESAVSGTQALRCTTCGGDGDPRDPKPKPKPPTSVAPDFSFELKICLPDAANTALKKTLAQRIAGGDVRTACVGIRQVVGIWLTQPSAFSPAAGRDAGLQTVSQMQDGESFALQLGAGGLTQEIDTVFAKQPHAMDEQGRPNAGGPVFLDSVDLSFGSSPARMTTVVNGHVTKGLTLGFDMTRVESLALAGQKVHCSANTTVNTPATTILDFLTGGFLALGDPLGLVALDFDRALHAQVTAFEGAASTECFVAAAIPDSIPIAGADAGPFFRGKKVDLQYSRLQVGGALGVAAGGLFQLVARAPKVAIAGSGEAPDHGTTVALAIDTKDLVPPLKVT
jgi:hypothetical protein